MNLGRLVGIVIALLALVIVPSAGAVTITEFPANPKTIFSFPIHITSGPDGNLWWTDVQTEPGIARMSPSGEYFPRIPDPNNPIDIVVAPSGWASWTSESGTGSLSPSGIPHHYSSSSEGGAVALTSSNKIRWGIRANASEYAFICGREEDTINTNSGSTCEEDFLTKGQVTGLAATPAGILWAAVYDENIIWTLNSSLEFQKTIELPTDSGPVGIAIGPEGNTWVAMEGASAIDRFLPDGTRTRFLLPPESEPLDIVLGPDGAFWITESGTGKIGRMSTSGVLTNEYPVPSGETNQIGITVGPDKNIWFTDPEAGKIGKLVPDPVLASLAPPLVLPKDTTAPSFLGSPSFSPSRFAVAGKVKARVSAAGKALRGSTLKFSLSEAAKVTATIARPAPGRKSGRKCVAPGKAKPAAAKCTRYVTKGALTLNGKPEANKAPFSGKLKGKALAAGSYRATLIARDAAGNVSQPKATTFTIIP